MNVSFFILVLFQIFSCQTPPSLQYSLPPCVWLDLRLSYLEALQSIQAVCDWVASRDSFL